MSPSERDRVGCSQALDERKEPSCAISETLTRVRVLAECGAVRLSGNAIALSKFGVGIQDVLHALRYATSCLVG